jgi:hypothetical protein
MLACASNQTSSLSLASVFAKQQRHSASHDIAIDPCACDTQIGSESLGNAQTPNSTGIEFAPSTFGFDSVSAQQMLACASNQTSSLSLASVFAKQQRHSASHDIATDPCACDTQIGSESLENAQTPNSTGSVAVRGISGLDFAPSPQQLSSAGTFGCESELDKLLGCGGNFAESLGSRAEPDIGECELG